MKVVLTVVLCFFVVLLLFTAGVLEMVGIDPDRIPTELYDQVGPYSPYYGRGEYVDSLTWYIPTDYIAVSDRFGYRTHPILKEWRLHDGIDLAAYQGTPIMATRGGTVTAAEWNDGAGWHVYIDHGDDFTTCYLHMTHFIVEAGQEVAGGEVIGYVGSTGNSTGPHLHFSVLYRGTPVDPSYYLSIAVPPPAEDDTTPTTQPTTTEDPT